jgi:hypothetical protein
LEPNHHIKNLLLRSTEKQGIVIITSLQKPHPQNDEITSQNKQPPPCTRKLTFSSEVIDQIFGILKDCFPLEQQTELKRILETGQNAQTKLLFNDSGNKLAHVLAICNFFLLIVSFCISSAESGQIFKLLLK